MTENTPCQQPLQPASLKEGGQYNWKSQPERLVYRGKQGSWHQFKKIDDDRPVWCEVLDGDLHMLEESAPAEQLGNAAIAAIQAEMIQPATGNTLPNHVIDAISAYGDARADGGDSGTALGVVITTMRALLSNIPQPVQPAPPVASAPVEWQAKAGANWRRIDPPKGETAEQRAAYLRTIKSKFGRPAYEIRALYTEAQPVQPAVRVHLLTYASTAQQRYMLDCITRDSGITFETAGGEK